MQRPPFRPMTTLPVRVSKQWLKMRSRPADSVTLPSVSPEDRIPRTRTLSAPRCTTWSVLSHPHRVAPARCPFHSSSHILFDAALPPVTAMLWPNSETAFQHHPTSSKPSSNCATHHFEVPGRFFTSDTNNAEKAARSFRLPIDRATLRCLTCGDELFREVSFATICRLDFMQHSLLFARVQWGSVCTSLRSGLS
ncbi:uncharacterized protein K452DRAFT_170340 [Aplosporella prunicola CBS 121167]|uniref:Uncharacterized protein n=1 Tax=Aplosporella prunicola CBS 121167 TaxID=1176127 RepID=A0A6A6BJ90_9PEZI|nr:uncharacterized protein K452DRAFT_170340 [Aplosporella prunicola CBS 121167]KAF2143395.1 hypothetical protein K452DRAFT_170340 [Aplosporella prunicola CBS 121167]